MNKTSKKILSAIMCIALLTLCATNAFAADLSNSVGSPATDFSAADVVGSDATQDKTSEYVDAVTDSTATAETKNATVNVYATQASTYSVKIPKTVVLNGADGSGAYRIGVKGNIAGNQTITVAPVDKDAEKEGVNFSLAEQGTVSQKSNITASIEQAKTAFVQSEISATDWTTTDATISAPAITAGAWTGTFDFNISITAA